VAIEAHCCFKLIPFYLENKPMRPLNLLLAAALMAAALPTFAQYGATKPAAAAAAKVELSDGEVRRIDAARGTVLLKHGEIKNIGMGAMTMSFKFKDPKMATGLAVGDKVQFAAEQKGDDLIVTQIVKKP
jgi:Cu/Ag efflux protein CusF